MDLNLESRSWESLTLTNYRLGIAPRDFLIPFKKGRGEIKVAGEKGGRGTLSERKRFLTKESRSGTPHVKIGVGEYVTNTLVYDLKEEEGEREREHMCVRACI